MKILADQNMPLVEAFFAEFGEVTRFDGRSLTPEQLIDVDVLLVRSVTKVNAAMLQNANKLKFVGTATIGVDHVDSVYLAERGIAFSSAPGCNAIAVAEYVISVMLAFSQENATPLAGKTLGIIGVGNIGQCLREKVASLGMKLLLCDPLRHEAGSLPEHVDVDTVLAEADIVTCHVPLVKTGAHCTKHLIDAQRLARLKPNAWLINASRGDVIDNQALLQHLQRGAGWQVALDVWENEPHILTDLLAYVRFATVHIAGHTLEGKARGTQMLYQAWCQLQGLNADKALAAFLPEPAVTACQLQATFTDADLGRLVHLIYDVRRDDGLLRSRLAADGFDYLRKNYPVRREFSTLTITNANDFAPVLAQLGFAVVATH
ncbi:4-phosphoerythronate dehydrogenase [Pseudoalteromonas fenneropenaei]|uniref:Erythronate-4-phosphate dehydrogenase n=1 Tax=Pseudoalteromonas fenneropenaei TaxID=1737459 RepID=A0ABV7CMW0_9GAMM